MDSTFTKSEPKKIQSKVEGYNIKNHDEYVNKHSTLLNKILLTIGEINFLIDPMKKFIPNENLFNLNKLEEDFIQCKYEASELLKHIEKKNFEIAIMGREKAGKSTLINALLGFKLLPDANVRCTYTTTEIKSCENDTEQRIEIEYLSRDDFIAYKRFLESKLCLESDSIDSKDLNQENESDTTYKHKDNNVEIRHDSLEDELKEIEETEKDPNAVKILDGPNRIEIIKFNNIDEIKNTLQRYVATMTMARTIKRLTIWLNNKKMNIKNVTLYDVPGFDSPTILHKNLTVERALTADEILFVKRFREPTLNESDIEMVRIFDRHNDFIPLKAKLIVALTFIHDVISKNSFDQTLLEINSAWNKHDIVADALVPVDCSSFANIDKEKEETIKNIVKKFNIPDGLTTIRNLIDTRIKSTRMNNFKKKLEIFNIHMKESVKNLKSIASQDFIINQNEEELKRSLENQKRAHKYEWWATQWRRIQNDLFDFYDNEISGRSNPDEYPKNNKYITEFRLKYEEMIEKLANSTISASRQDQLKVYKATGGYNPNGHIIASEAHFKIREKLRDEVYHKISEIMCKELANIVWNVISKIVDSISASMWNIEDIKDILLNDNIINTKFLIQKQIETLVLRLSRTAAELFLRIPRNDPARRKLIETEKELIITLDMFFRENGESKRKGLPMFLINGTFETVDYFGLDFSVEVDTSYEILNDFQSIHNEIITDFTEFLNYMKNSVYYASGLEEFFNQELHKIKKIFELEHDKALTWQNLVFTAIEDGNPNIPTEEFELDLIEKLKISESLMNAIKSFNELIN